MNPFYFGPAERPVFGVFSPARGRDGPSRAALLCYPIAGEYLRAHRAFRQLTVLLSRNGVSVLRFDYSCTGDSGGAGEEADLERWLDDVGWAADELRAMTGVDRVSLIGLRFGAAIAGLVAERRPDVGHLVLWDPVVSGERYAAGMPAPPDPETNAAVEGFPITPELRSAIAEVDLTRLGGCRAESASLLLSKERPEHQALRNRLGDHGVEADLEVIPSSGSWTQPDPFGSAYIPERIIQRIVARVTAAAGATA